MVLQQGKHVCRLVGVGVHPPGLVGAGVEAERLKPAQRVGRVDGSQQRLEPGRVRGEIPLGRDAGVVQIAAAIAGGQQLFAGFCIPLQHRHPRPGLRCRQCGGKPGGSAAQNQNLLHLFPPSLLYITV